MSFLRDRAEEFLDNAKYNLGRGFYNLVMFDVEQYIQLYCKFLIYLKVGDYPKTHDILALLRDIDKLYSSRCEVSEFITKNKDFLYVIYFSYTQGRYFGTQFTKEDAERSVEIAEKFSGIIRCLTS
ncbi:DNA-binding protein [Sulfolobales archaeon HS-7]|nr:DNA-binding protein [Sulfolobales archaeon HS-7]